MPIVTIVGLPGDLSQENIRKIKKAVKEDVASVKELSLTESQVSVVLLKDMLEDTSSRLEITATVIGLFVRPERTKEVRNELANRLVLGLKPCIWGLKYEIESIKCLVIPFDPEQGFASYP